MTQELLAETDGAVATFTLNRPERLNAITPRMIDALDAALAAALGGRRGAGDPAARRRAGFLCRL